MKKFSIPAKFNNRFLLELEKGNRLDYIYEVYGALPTGIIGHGRPFHEVVLEDIELNEFLLS